MGAVRSSDLLSGSWTKPSSVFTCDKIYWDICAEKHITPEGQCQPVSTSDRGWIPLTCPPLALMLLLSSPFCSSLTSMVSLEVQEEFEGSTMRGSFSKIQQWRELVTKKLKTQTLTLTFLGAVQVLLFVYIISCNGPLAQLTAAITERCLSCESHSAQLLL